jgi:mono/diheme cytochrome c family protein
MKFMHAGIALVTFVLGMQASPAGNSGKAIFEKTCAQCHGPEGKGKPSADKFYQIAIPRLYSAYVQRKSDDELREVITKGRRKMEPVRMGRPVAQHKINLEAADVTAVIGYVRTLHEN